MIQHINDIHPGSKFFRFRHPHALNKVGIEAEKRRAFDPFQTKTAILSGRRIDKNVFNSVSPKRPDVLAESFQR